MKKHFCLDITFPEVNFDLYYKGYQPAKPLHHAHLYTKRNAIELRVFFEGNTGLGMKMLYWMHSINTRKFGSYLRVSNETQNEDMLKLDLSESIALQWTVSDKQVEGQYSFISIKIDRFKIYWKPSQHEPNTGDFYLNEEGFEAVKDFYSSLFGWDGKFEIVRMKGREGFYSLANTNFRPEFDFTYRGDRSSSEHVIEKIPKIKFSYKEVVTEDKALLYADIVRLIASFFYHLPIDYTVSRIHLPKHTVVVRKLQGKRSQLRGQSLRALKYPWEFNRFLTTDWQEHAIKNHTKLSKVIGLFNQANLVDNSSGFLIRFNIVEICMGGKKESPTKFTLTLPPKRVKAKYKEALEILLKTVRAEDAELFKKKWSVASQKLKDKPMGSTIEDFLRKQNLPVERFPITVKEMKEIRDNLTHGSIDNVNEEKLRQANVLLYRITGILILNLLGITEWELDVTLK